MSFSNQLICILSHNYWTNFEVQTSSAHQNDSLNLSFVIDICVDNSHLLFHKESSPEKYICISCHNYWEAWAEFCQIFHSCFVQWSFKKKCFWDLLTFTIALWSTVVLKNKSKSNESMNEWNSWKRLVCTKEGVTTREIIVCKVWDQKRRWTQARRPAANRSDHSGRKLPFLPNWSL